MAGISCNVSMIELFQNKLSLTAATLCSQSFLSSDKTDCIFDISSARSLALKTWKGSKQTRQLKKTNKQTKTLMTFFPLYKLHVAHKSLNRSFRIANIETALKRRIKNEGKKTTLKKRKSLSVKSNYPCTRNPLFASFANQTRTLHKSMCCYHLRTFTSGQSKNAFSKSASSTAPADAKRKKRQCQFMRNKIELQVVDVIVQVLVNVTLKLAAVFLSQQHSAIQVTAKNNDSNLGE